MVLLGFKRPFHVDSQLKEVRVRSDVSSFTFTYYALVGTFFFCFRILIRNFFFSFSLSLRAGLAESILSEIVIWVKTVPPTEERSICLDCLTVFSFPDSLLTSSATRPGSISEIDIITSGGLWVGVDPPPGVC